MPSVVRSGERLRFVVTLTNPTDRALSLAPCPGYRIVLAGKENAGGFQPERTLPCDPATPIPPGGSERYEMVTDVPTGFTGRMLVHWEPVPTGDRIDASVLVYGNT